MGLGRMGASMARRLMEAGIRCVVFDLRPQSVAALVKDGAIGVRSMTDFAAKLGRAARHLDDGAGGRRRCDDRRPGGRVVAPTTFSSTAATRTTGTISPAPRRLRPRASTMSTSARAAASSGLQRGFCQMIGGDDAIVRRLDPIFAALAPATDAAPRTPGRQAGVDRRARLPALRTGRRRPFRQDGPQRHRVRHDGGLRRGLQHPAPRQCRRA